MKALPQTPQTPGQRPWTVKSHIPRPPRPAVNSIVTRRYDIRWLDASGAAASKTAVAPALPIFEQAFSAFAQGTLIQTTGGYVAVEDLQPGDRLATADSGNRRLLWIGSMTLFPHGEAIGLPQASLYRISDGSFGLDPCAPDLLLGPSARILPGLFAVDSSSPLHDIGDLTDSQSVIRIRPVSPVRVFHLGLERHCLLRANGVLAESFHPGDNPRIHLSTEMFALYMSLFPHVEDLSGFGPLRHPRRG
jgi:hypothetical protein